MNPLHWTAADLQAFVAAAGVIGGFILWLWHQRKAASALLPAGFPEIFRSTLRLVQRAVKHSAKGKHVSGFPAVTLEAGIAYARTATRSGHPPYTVTQGRPSPEQPLDYLLAKTAEVVWEAVTSAHSELEPYLLPLRGYVAALAGKAGGSPARDFALGVLTERVRQEEDGWPDQEGDGKRGAHGTAHHASSCLLERKHDVEKAIYGINGGCEHP